MPDSKGIEIVQRHEKLLSANANNFQRWDKMAPLLAPSRCGILGQRSLGATLTNGLYDSTTLMAAELMAMFMAGHSINPAQRWIHWRMKHPAVRDSDAIKEWLEECRDRFLDQMQSSFFYSETPESMIDLVGFGTGCTFMEEAAQLDNYSQAGFRGFHVRSERTGRFIISEGGNGLVDTVMREIGLSARICNDLWGSNTGYKLPENVQKAVTEGQLDKEFKFIHSVEPRPRSQQGPGNKGMPWAAYWVEKESKEITKESGYRVFPAAIPRFQKTPGEVFGRGRGDIAFPDTWTINAAKRLSLEDFALKVRPPFAHGHNSVVGTIRIVPGAPISVNTHGKPIREAIMPWETGSRPEVSALVMEEIRQQIRQIFFVEQILQLLESHKSEMTAFEFARKLELLFRLMAPTYGRIEFELLHRISDIGFETMFEAGAFSDPPEELYESDGRIETVFHNPIALAQRSGDPESLLMSINDLAPLINAGKTEILDHYETDEATQGVMNARGVPARWVRNMKDILKIRAARQEQESKDLQMQQMAEMAQAAGKAAPAMKMAQEMNK